MKPRSPLAPLTLCAVTLMALAGCGGKTSTKPATVTVGQRLVAFASDRNGSLDIFLYDLAGTFLYNLPGLNDPAAIDRHPSLGSDGQVLAFATNRAGGMGDYDIRIYDLASSAFATTPPINTIGREDEPAFTGDALSLLFVRDTMSVRRIRMFYGVSGKFIPLPGIDAPPGFNDWAPAPNLNGSRTAFVSDRNGNPDIFVYDAVGDSLFDIPDLVSDSSDTDPSLTPDGRYLAFASTRPGGMGGYDIYLYDLQARMFINLVAGANSAMDDRHPSLSTDGTVMSFESNRTSGFGGFDVWNHDRQTGVTGQGGNESSTGEDVSPSIRWP